MKLLILVIMSFGLNAYAGLGDLVRGQLCNESGGYEHGLNDARGGRPMNHAFTKLCDEGDRSKIEKSYRDGFMTGLQTVNNTPAKTEINVNVASNGNGGEVKKVYCELKPFTSTFSAWGASDLEAKINVKEKCTKQYNEMHCTDYDCKTAD